MLIDLDLGKQHGLILYDAKVKSVVILFVPESEVKFFARAVLGDIVLRPLSKSGLVTSAAFRVSVRVTADA